MSVRKKLTEMESTSAFVVGGGLALIILGFLLSAFRSRIEQRVNEDFDRYFV